MRLTSGSRVGRYEVRELLGSGGMGEVYRAYDSDLERDVAVKVLHDAESDGDRLRRFVQEAKAASGLHHPNVAHVYEIGSHDGIRYIAMEIVEGETLRHRLRRGAMPIDDAIDIAAQIAGALAAAHKSGIIHRDVKPENVIITPDGHAKVLDFGLAKLRELQGEEAATMLKTAPGIAMGTLGYMAPEMFRSGAITPAADVWALGVVMHEMVGGERPSGQKQLHELRPDVPPKLEALIARSLLANPTERPQSASVVYDELKAISRAVAIPAPASAAFPWGKIVAIAAALFIAVLGGWLIWQKARERDARRQAIVAENLMKERKLAEAYEIASAAAVVLPNDEQLRDIIARAAGRVEIDSDPRGATVYLQRFGGPGTRKRMGTTPLTIPRLPRADYLVTLEKSGYAPVTRSLALAPLYVIGDAFNWPTEPIRAKLTEASLAPKGMVFVQGGPTRLTGFQRPSDRLVELGDFFIDQHEVTNRDFEEFIRDRGYRRRELWKHPFVDRGRALTFEEAMGRFRDKTGLSAPRSWSAGVPPAGYENHPVTDVTWYEAAAFAEWKGKKLPTLYQWEKAAFYPLSSRAANVLPWGFLSPGVEATERANFQGKGTMAVDTMPFGASRWGALHMAGNVSEWCRNSKGDGYTARGGSWNDAVYQFGATAALPTFFSSATIGFRCVSGGSGDEGAFALSAREPVPSYEPVDDATFEQFRQRYEYARTPLQARVVETVDAPDWTREKIHYVVAGKTVPAYLYLPKRFPRPLPVIHFAPAGDVVGGFRSLPRSIEAQLAPFIRAGRAIFSVEQEGFIGRPRPPGWVPPDPAEEEYVDLNFARVTEFRRGLDYLETRPDIDRARIAFFGISAGGGPGVFATALESRYRTVVFAGTGISIREKIYAPAANRIHFVSRIRAPKMMLQGRYDEDTALATEAEPMFNLLREPKKLELHEGGHIAPREITVPVVSKWLDETMP